MRDCESPENPRLAMTADNDDFRAGTCGPDPVALTIQDVSRMLQVPAPTIRSWERRYGVPMVSRSDGGHRRYTQDQFAMLRHMRDEISRGYPAVEASALAKAAQSRSTGPLIATFTDAAHSLDPSGIEQLLDTAHQALGLGRTIDEVLLPAMREIGRWWESGRCDVTHEQLATRTSQAWLSSIGPSGPSGPVRPVLLSCGPRDHHTLGLEAMAALLRSRGLDCRLLGARTSAETLAQAVQQIDPAAVIVVSHLSMARRAAVEALRPIQRPDLVLFHAGNAFLSASARRGVPGTYLGTNLAQAADVVIGTIPASA